MGMINDGLSYWQAETEGIELLNTTLGDLLDSRAEQIPVREAVVYSCYPEFAAAKAGLVLVTVNPVYRANELEYVLKQGDVKALFFMAQVRDHNCLATVRSMVTPGEKHGEVSSEHLPELRTVCLIGAAPKELLEQEGWRPTLFGEMVVGGATVSDEQVRERQAAVKPSDPMLILYTSGTTGFPKGAMLTHDSVINNWMMLFHRIDAMGGDGAYYCLPMPLFHIGGAGIAIGTVIAKMTLHPLVAFDPLKALEIIQQEHCEYLLAVPTMLEQRYVTASTSASYPR
jgi:fatty-acyl-CoA synthase